MPVDGLTNNGDLSNNIRKSWTEVRRKEGKSSYIIPQTMTLVGLYDSQPPLNRAMERVKDRTMQSSEWYVTTSNILRNGREL